MTYKVLSDLAVSGTIKVNGKVSGVSITLTDHPEVYNADTNGHVQIPVPAPSVFDNILKLLPLSQYGLINNNPVNISTSGYNITFNEVTPVFIGGQYFELPVTTINLTSVLANPANTKFYVYLRLLYGSPGYAISNTELVETQTTMFIGTIQTNASQISSTNITKVSKFDNYRPSTTIIGGAFPVSTGNPLDPGTISW